MSSTQAIENLINGYATSEDSSFLIPNVTGDFLAVKPSGNGRVTGTRRQPCAYVKSLCVSLSAARR